MQASSWPTGSGITGVGAGDWKSALIEMGLSIGETIITNYVNKKMNETQGSVPLLALSL